MPARIYKVNIKLNYIFRKNLFFERKKTYITIQLYFDDKTFWYNVKS